MFEATLERASILKRIIDSIAPLLQEVNLDCTSEGITLQALDSAHVSLVSLLIRQDGFSYYHCDRPMTLGINLESLNKILKCAGNDDVLKLFAKDDSDHIVFMFEYKNKLSEFELKLMEINLEKLKIPQNTTYNAILQMPSAEFQKIISSLVSLGDTVTIKLTKGSVKLSVSGDFKGSVCIKPRLSENNDEPDTTVEVSNEDVISTFAMRYIHSFTKATGLSSSVRINLSPEIPLMVEYQIEDVSGFIRDYKKEHKDENSKESVRSKVNSRGYIRYYLAPKIDDES